MRLLIVLLIVALCMWKLWPRPPADEEAYVSPQEKLLHDSKAFEDDMIEANQQRLKDADGG